MTHPSLHRRVPLARTALRRKPMKWPRPSKKRSAKKRAEDREWRDASRERSELFPIWIRSRCEWPGCEAAWTDAHHALKRRFFNLVWPWARKFICRLLCRKHHQYVEEHPAEARMLEMSMTLAEARERGYLRTDGEG